MPGCYWQAQGSRPAFSKRLFAPVHACRRCGLPSPCQSAPGSPSLVFINRQSRPRITTRFTYDKCSAYLLTVTVRRVDNYRFFFRAQGAERGLPGEGRVMPVGRQHDPQSFPTAHTGYAPFYTSNPHGHAQLTRGLRGHLMIEFAAAGTYHGRMRGLRSDERAGAGRGGCRAPAPE